MIELFNLEHKVAMVTGATGGIGKASVEALLSAGASVHCLARSQEKLQWLDAELKSDFPNSVWYLHPLDCNSQQEINTVFAEIGEAHVLVNSVGVNIPKGLLQLTEEDYDTVLNANLKSAFFQTQAFLRHFSSLKTGSIIHISSQMGLVGGFDRAIYCASKHGLEGMVKASSIELGEHGIRINTICPTFIETALTKATLSDKTKREKIMQKLLIKRLGELSDLHGAIIYLASDASKLVTATALKVDGGWTAH